MDKDRVQGFVAGLEQILKNTHLSLKDEAAQFHELCQRVTPERHVPQGIIVDIRKAYKRIQDQLTKVQGIQQLLQGKYARYYRRDPLRDRESTEFGFVAKNLYFKFESTLQQIEAQRRLREQERALRPGELMPFSWFRSRENQVLLVRTSRQLSDLNYTVPLHSLPQERRRVTHDGPRSLSLFVFAGEGKVVDELQSRMRLRQHDIAERYDTQEIRGMLTHLREMSLAEKENVVRRFKEDQGFSKIRCLLFSVQSHEDFQEEVFKTTERILEQIGEGEMKTFPIPHPALL